MSKAAIYTRSGDQGLTSLLDGTRVKKYDLRVETYGTIDELNSVIGFARQFMNNDTMIERLKETQRDLFAMAAELADPSGRYAANFTDETIKKLETWIDQATALYDPTPKFILPGSNKESGALHIARTVCRRAERLLTELSDQSPVSPLLVKYSNRLSDLIYVYARYAEESQETV